MKGRWCEGFGGVGNGKDLRRFLFERLITGGNLAGNGGRVRRNGGRSSKSDGEGHQKVCDYPKNEGTFLSKAGQK